MRAAPWQERGGSEREHEEKGWTPQLTKADSKEEKGGQARRASLGEEEGGMSG